MPNHPLLLDTHCWVWAQLGLIQRLSRTAVSAIRDAESEGNLRVSVISVWELAMLEKRGRVALPMNVRTWVEEALSKPGVSVAPLTPEIAIESVHLPGELHGDPADRMLIATARVLGATLLTKDAYKSDAYKRGKPKEDTFVLVAGDSDYVPTIKALQEDGFIVEVVFWNHASRELKEVASRFIGLDPFLDALRL